MAPSSKLKQSPIDSFLHPKPKSSRLPSPSPTNSAASGSDYELIRRDTIRRNQDFLQKLGIFATATAVSAGPKPKPPPRRICKTPTTPESCRLPLRRSSRHKAPPTPSTDDSAVAIESSPVEPPSFVDSSVFQYVCDDEASGAIGVVKSSPSSPIIGFKVVGKPFRDPSLTKIYSVDVSFLKRDRFLVAAGGHGGFISVYGGGVEPDDCAEEDPEGGFIEPLMSWKGFSSWVAGVKFVKDNPFLLISSSNDGSVVVWDVKKQSIMTRYLSPPVVAKSTELHSGGIFGMDQLDCWIATCSKDSSVGISRLTPVGELVAERTFSGHHSGVIRGVSFGDEKHHIADCGADGNICVLDARLAKPCALTIDAQHSASINTVEWSKSNSHLILSGSKDPVLRVHDIRSPAEPVVHSELQGHVESHAGTCYQIYRPCFVGKNLIATPGQGSRKISLYDVEKRAMISKGRIGYDANLVKFTGDAEDPRLWAAGRQINQLCPLLEPIIDTQMFL